MRRPHQLTATAIAAACVLALAACGSSDDADGADGGAGASGDGVVDVVASTNVWGDLVATIGGDAVSVTSIIDDPSADPHSFEADTRTQLALSRADLVVENGGGYDDFVDTMLAATDGDPVVVTAVDVSGLDASAEGFNEHVWYDATATAQVAATVVSELSTIAPEHTATFEANGSALQDQLVALAQREAEASATTAGLPVATTEPVPGYMLAALGTEDVTPTAFTEAIEEETEVSPAVLQETLALFTSGSVRALVYNSQTTGAATDEVLAAAQAAGVPAVPVTETLPEGEDYLSWMTSNLDAITAALQP